MTLLDRTSPTLPSHWYYDPGHYGRELEAVWYRDWICVGRAEEIARPGDYVLRDVGHEQVIVTRDAGGRHRAFFNTCRHRGSRLRTEPRGHFAHGRIVCPYHAWSYSLDGTLAATPLRIESDDFNRGDHALYAAHLDSWGGFLFANLGTSPPVPLLHFLGTEARNVERWPLAALESVHRERHTIGCNWKVFWENYSECYHCPGVHPELCRIVPIYRDGVLNYADRPGNQPGEPPADPRPRVAQGLQTWTLDGRSTLPLIDGPTEHERSLGVVFASFTASLYVVAHPDYVRSVRVAPQGPQQTELTVDWLLPPGVASAHAADLDRMLALGRTVIAQDARVCELNQQGLKCRRHEHGVLVPQEQSLSQFHEWLRSRLADI